MSAKYLGQNFVRYLITGGLSVLVDYGTLMFLYRVLHVRLVVAVTVSYVLALVVNFLLTKLYTFQSRSGGHKKHAKEAAGYLILVGFNLIFTNFVILQMSNAGIGPSISKLITVACITLWNYYLYKHLIFKSNHNTERSVSTT